MNGVTGNGSPFASVSSLHQKEDWGEVSSSTTWLKSRRFYENAAFKVAATLRRGGSSVQTDRRSEIGSHATPMTAIFIRGGELEEGDYSLIKKAQLYLLGEGL